MQILRFTKHFYSKSPRKTFPQHCRQIKSRVKVYIFLDSQLLLGRSNKFNNKGMKVQIKRVFKRNFCHQIIIIKKQTDYIWHFLPNMSREKWLYPLFLNQWLLFLLLPLLFEEHLNHQVGSTKLPYCWLPTWFSKISINYTSSHISTDFLGFYLSFQNIWWTFSEICISQHGRGKFSNWCCLHYWSMHSWLKKLNLFTFTHVPQARFLSSHSERGKLLSNQRQNFFKIEPLCLRGERNCKSGGKAKSDQN